MLEWYVCFSDDPHGFEQAIGKDDREEIQRTFKEAALSGVFQSRPLLWMILIDAGSGLRNVLACYGNKPPPMLEPARVSMAA